MLHRTEKKHKCNQPALITGSAVTAATCFATPTSINAVIYYQHTLVTSALVPRLASRHHLPNRELIRNTQQPELELHCHCRLAARPSTSLSHFDLTEREKGKRQVRETQSGASRLH
jgi:hypothetical protein